MTNDLQYYRTKAEAARKAAAAAINEKDYEAAFLLLEEAETADTDAALVSISSLT